MSCKPVFLSCSHCRNIVQVIQSEPEREFECCQTPLKEMVPNTSEGAAEKHLPVVELDGNHVTVKVGDIFHPMTEEHSIDWVYLETEKGGQIYYLKSEKEPVAHFVMTANDRPVAAYAFCNLHGFWKTEIH